MTAISIEGVSKNYRLGSIDGSTVSAEVARWWARRRGKLQPPISHARGQARQVGNLFRALDDVSFEVAQGEVVGLIGPNGAGKSTLLKILSQLTAPSSGTIRVRGRVASLLEVGTGFHPELTGRENVFLNGAILGMSKAELKAKYDEIVEFSGCEAFIDTPVKRYSSGMYVRLAFAVAAHLESEVLIIDEVLAVGDAQFQKKCLGKVRDVAGHGRTIIFVSHSMAAISALCPRAILLRGGHIAEDGDAADVIAAYDSERFATEKSTFDFSEIKREGTGRGHFQSLSVSALNNKGEQIDFAIPGSDMRLEMEIECRDAFKDANAAAVLWDAQGSRIVDVNTALGGEFLSMRPGERVKVSFHLKDVLLKPGMYRVTLWLGRAGIEAYDLIEHAGTWSVQEGVVETKHTETFPGVYQCRFTHAIEAMG